MAKARKALGRAKIDLALLDIRLGSETVFPISEMLEGMAKPWTARGLLALIPQVLRASGHANATEPRHQIW